MANHYINKLNDKVYKSVCAEDIIGECIILNSMICGLDLVIF